MTTRNFYDVLGLAPFADGAMVDQAYWHLAKTYQTQAVADPRARIQLDELNDAYAVLGTPRLREAYDLELAGLRPHDSRAAGPRGRGEPAPRRKRRSLSFSWPFGKKTAAVRPDEAPPEPTVDPIRSRPVAARPAARANVTDLRASTAEMLERWRSSAGNHQATPEADAAAPDMTLVDIFKTEKDIEAHPDPLTAVMEILKAGDTVPASRDS